MFRHPLRSFLPAIAIVVSIFSFAQLLGGTRLRGLSNEVAADLAARAAAAVVEEPEVPEPIVKPKRTRTRKTTTETATAAQDTSPTIPAEGSVPAEETSTKPKAKRTRKPKAVKKEEDEIGIVRLKNHLKCACSDCFTRDRRFATVQESVGCRDSWKPCEVPALYPSHQSRAVLRGEHTLRVSQYPHSNLGVASPTLIKQQRSQNYSTSSWHPSHGEENAFSCAVSPSCT